MLATAQDDLAPRELTPTAADSGATSDGSTASHGTQEDDIVQGEVTQALQISGEAVHQSNQAPAIKKRRRRRKHVQDINMVEYIRIQRARGPARKWARQW
eukprot:jgi/Chrzof1/5823/Cz16g17060.t1